jgi:hypothetical protein
MNEYFSCLNASKTKILVIAPPSIQPEMIIRGVFINNVCIRFVESAKDLGVILDNVLSFKSQVHKVIKAFHCTIKDVSSIKGFLSESHLKQLVCSCIFSLLDYCNYLYFVIRLLLIP